MSQSSKDKKHEKTLAKFHLTANPKMYETPTGKKFFSHENRPFEISFGTYFQCSGGKKPSSCEGLRGGKNLNLEPYEDPKVE